MSLKKILVRNQLLRYRKSGIKTDHKIVNVGYLVKDNSDLGGFRVSMLPPTQPSEKKIVIIHISNIYELVYVCEIRKFPRIIWF